MSTEKFLFEIATDLKQMRQDIVGGKGDLKSLGKQVKKTEGKFKNFGASAAKGLTAVAAAGTAAAGALTAATVAAVNYSRELTVASRRSRENIESLQSTAFATKTVGISMEKLGDIGKDTNEKVGEFLADGTGGFLDFVSVAKLTDEEAQSMAESFKHMSGTEVLQAMVTRMEEAGAETKEMSFALEGMASDTTDLIPLLKDGGKELKRLKDDFKDLNVTLTATDIKRITKLGEETAKLGLAVQNSSAKTVSVLSTEITQVTQMLANSAQDVGGLVIKAVTGYQAIVVSATSGLMNMFREAEILAVEAKNFIVGVFGDNSDIEAELTKLKESDALRDAFDATYLADQWDAAKLKVEEYYGEIKNQEESAPEITSPTNPDGEGDGTGERVSEKEQEKLDALKLFTMTRAEILDAEFIADLERLELAGETFGLKDEELYARRLEIIKKFAGDKERLEKKNLANKDKDIKTETKWSDSATKKQLDDGTALLTSLGNNSKTAHKIKQGLASANVIMTTSENITEQFPNPAGMALAAATGAAQLAAILSSTPNGGGSTSTAPAAPEQQPVQAFDEQGTTVTDISDGEQSTQVMQLIIDGEALEVMGRSIAAKDRNGQI